jgi:uncharacterized protein YndB with AHSA1/START domain
MTRTYAHEEVFPVSPEALFTLLHTPSAIREWWGAERAIVIPEPDGFWAAAWGEDEDDPDFIVAATLQEFESPRRIVLSKYRYRSKSGELPFEAQFAVEFVVAPHPEGAVLRVCQDGFPAGPEADEFLAGCEQGWRDTFDGIREFIADGAG